MIIEHTLCKMADLDDFFAKKDRKKSKNVKKFATADEVAKKLEDTKKADKLIKKDRVLPSGQEGDESGAPVHEQDEWKDFEEEKKDYSGLKIGHLSISATGEGSAGNADGSSEAPAGSDESGNEPDRKTGPWKRVNTEQAAQPEPEKPVEQAPQRSMSSAGYVPPHLRNQSSQQQPSRLKSKTAPDIHNEEYFPTLSGGNKNEGGAQGAWGKRNRNEGNFEEVRHSKASSYRQAEQSKLSSGQGPKLNLGNRYGSLSNENNS